MTPTNHPDEAPLRAVIYARLSADQKKEGKSVGDQIAEGKREIERNGWILAGIFQDNDRSASRNARKARPEYEKLIEYLQAGHADVLITRESSRAQRDLEVYVKLRNLCAQTGVLWSYKGRVHNLTHTDDRFQTGLDALLAEREADVVKDRVVNGQRASADAGRPPNRTPYGYRREYDPRTRALVAQFINEAEAVIIREAAKRYAAGDSMRSIVLDFTGRGLRRPGGGTWTVGTLQRVISNPTYIGKRVYRGQVHGDGNWEPILDAAVFYACARRREDARTRYGKREIEPRFVLSRSVSCGECGSPMSAKVGSHAGKYVYYCFGSPPGSCGRVSILVERLDGHVIGLVIERLSRPDAADLLAADDGGDEELLAALAEADELRARLQAFVDQAADGHLTAKALSSIEAKLLPQINAAEQRAASVKLPAALQDAIRADIRAVWPTLSISRRREIVRALMEITVMPAAKPGHRPFDPSRVRIVWKHDI